MAEIVGFYHRYGYIVLISSGSNDEYYRRGGNVAPHSDWVVPLSKPHANLRTIRRWCTESTRKIAHENFKPYGGVYLSEDNDETLAMRFGDPPLPENKNRRKAGHPGTELQPSTSTVHGFLTKNSPAAIKILLSVLCVMPNLERIRILADRNILFDALIGLKARFNQPLFGHMRHHSDDAANLSRDLDSAIDELVLNNILSLSEDGLQYIPNHICLKTAHDHIFSNEVFPPVLFRDAVHAARTLRANQKVVSPALTTVNTKGNGEPVQVLPTTDGKNWYYLYASYIKHGSRAIPGSVTRQRVCKCDKDTLLPDEKHRDKDDTSFFEACKWALEHGFTLDGPTANRFRSLSDR